MWPSHLRIGLTSLILVIAAVASGQKGPPKEPRPEVPDAGAPLRRINPDQELVDDLELLKNLELLRDLEMYAPSDAGPSRKR